MYLYSCVEDSIFKTYLDGDGGGGCFSSPYVLTPGEGEITFSDTSSWAAAGQGGMPPPSYSNCGPLEMGDPYELQNSFSFLSVVKKCHHQDSGSVKEWKSNYLCFISHAVN